MRKFDRVIEKLFVYSKKKDAGHLEIFLIEKKSLEIRYFKGDLEHFGTNESVGISLRLFKDDREGFAYSEDLSDQALEDLICRAIEITRVGPLKEGIVEEGIKISLGGVPKDLKIFDDTLSKVGLAEKKDLAKAIESKALSTSSKVVAVPYSGYFEEEVFIRVGTLEGLGRSCRKNLASIFCNPLLEGKKDKKETFELQVCKKFNLLDSSLVAKKSVGDGLERLGASEISSGEYSIVLDRKMAAELLQAFSPMFFAKRVQEHQSVLSGREGQKVFRSGLVVIDDALLPDGYATRPFDHEGTLSKTTLLVEDGILSGLLHNRETAWKTNKDLTGHGARCLKSDVGIAPTNLFIENGKIPVEELLKVEKECIKIVELQGLHSGTDSISGDFSLSAQGFLYKKGKRGKPIHNFVVSGNILDVLGQDVMVGNDFLLQPSITDSAFGSPSIFIPSAKISGK